MSENGGPRNTTTILRGALGELNERRERLEPFVSELRDVDHAIKTIEKALRSVPTSRGGGSRPNGQGGGTQREQVLAVLRESFDPLAAGQISEATGISRASIYAVLSKMESAGEVVKVEGKYGLPVVAASEME